MTKVRTVGLIAAGALIGAIGYRLIGGSPTADKVPALDLHDGTLVFVSESSCTGTVIGPRTVLTAAHCFLWSGQPPSTPETELWIRGDKYAGTCHPAPNYKPGDPHPRANDLAWCTTDRDIVGVPFEVVRTDQGVAKGDWITLVGFGCDDGASGSTAVTLRTGKAKVSEPKTVLNQIITDPASTVTSCGGDSGGGVYVELADTNGSRSRRLVGVIAGHKDKATHIAALNGSSLKWSDVGVACGVNGTHGAGQQGCRW